MATSQLLTDTKKFDGMIVNVITDLRKKHKRVTLVKKTSVTDLRYVSAPLSDT